MDDRSVSQNVHGRHFPVCNTRRSIRAVPFLQRTAAGQVPDVRMQAVQSGVVDVLIRTFTRIPSDPARHFLYVQNNVHCRSHRTSSSPIILTRCRDNRKAERPGYLTEAFLCALGSSVSSKTTW